MRSMNLNINTGGKVIPVYASDKGRTSIVEYRPTPPKRHELLAQEMTNRARDYYPNPRENELGRQLFNQVAGREVLADNKVSAELESRFHAWQSDLVSAERLGRELFEQVANAR